MLPFALGHIVWFLFLLSIQKVFFYNSKFCALKMENIQKKKINCKKLNFANTNINEKNNSTNSI